MIVSVTVYTSCVCVGLCLYQLADVGCCTALNWRVCVTTTFCSAAVTKTRPQGQKHAALLLAGRCVVTCMMSSHIWSLYYCDARVNSSWILEIEIFVTLTKLNSNYRITLRLFFYFLRKTSCDVTFTVRGLLVCRLTVVLPTDCWFVVWLLVWRLTVALQAYCLSAVLLSVCCLTVSLQSDCFSYKCWTVQPETNINIRPLHLSVCFKDYLEPLCEPHGPSIMTPELSQKLQTIFRPPKDSWIYHKPPFWRTFDTSPKTVWNFLMTPWTSLMTCRSPSMPLRNVCSAV